VTAAGLVARAAALAATTFLLVATSEVQDRCEKPAEVTFRIAGSCGPTGLVIVSTGAASGSLTVENAALAGIPSSGDYQGTACPATLAQGGWRLEQLVCAASSGDGGGADASLAPTDAASPNRDATGGPCVEVEQACAATMIGGQLWLTCSTGTTGESCASTLTVVP
jgi:hypothetical protein